jgi:hypothetical membrane protein
MRSDRTPVHRRQTNRSNPGIARAPRQLEFDRRVIFTALLALLGICTFCVLCATAIRDYQRPDGEPYALTLQFLSDLGMSDSNVAHYFNRGLIVLGITLIPFFLAVPGIDRPDAVWLRFIGLSGGVASMGLIGLGLFPADFDMHNVMLALWAIPTPFAIICFLAAMSRSQPRGIYVPCLSLALLFASIIIMLLMQHSIILLQKVAVIALLLWFPAMVVFAIQLSISVVTLPDSIDDDTEAYIARIRTGTIRRQRG